MPRTRVKAKSSIKIERISKDKEEVRGKKRKRSDDGTNGRSDGGRTRKKRREPTEEEKERKKMKTSWMRDIRAILRSSGNELVFPEKLKRNRKVRIQSKSKCIVEDDNVRILLRCDSHSEVEGCSRETYQASDTVGATVQLEHRPVLIPDPSLIINSTKTLSCSADDEINNVANDENEYSLMEIDNSINGDPTSENAMNDRSDTDIRSDEMIESKSSFEGVKITVRSDKKISDEEEEFDLVNEDGERKGIVIDCDIPKQTTLDLDTEQESKFIQDTNSLSSVDKEINGVSHEVSRLDDENSSGGSADKEEDEVAFYFGNYAKENDSRCETVYSFATRRTEDNGIETNGVNHEDNLIEENGSPSTTFNRHDLDSDRYRSHSIYTADEEDRVSSEYFNCIDIPSNRQTNNLFNEYTNNSESTDDLNKSLPAYYDCKNAFLDAAAIHEDKSNASITLKKTWGSIKNLLSRVSGQSNGSEPKDNEGDGYTYKNPQGDFGT